MRKLKISSRFVFGIFIVLIGAILLLSNLDLFEVDLSIGTFWPMILIVIGVVKLINYDESTFAGVILLTLGGYFQLRNLDVEFIQDISLGSIIIPTIVILIGLSMLLDRDKPRVTVHKHTVNGSHNSMDEEYKDVDID